MRLTLFQLTFAFATTTSLFGITVADEPTMPSANSKEAAGAVSEETVAYLIRQLADSSTEKRDVAAKHLIEIGTPAKAQLEAASKSKNSLISRKVKMLLLSINRRNQNAN